MSKRDQNRGNSFRSRAAFTLLEVIVSLALIALVLVALNTFIFSMGELWGRNDDVRLFEQHVRSVTRFLDSELRNAALPPAGQPNAAAISPQDVKNESGITESMLSFTLPKGSRLISWPERALPDVVCALAVRDRQGLVLLWHSKLEKKFTQDPPRETLITPLVTGLSYDYYDPDFKQWKNETTIERDNNNQYKAPQRIRLKFTYGKLTRESVVTLPVPVEGLPLF